MKKYHYEGKEQDSGCHIFTECNGPGIFRFRKMESGKTTPMGAELVNIRKCRGNNPHFEVTSLLDGQDLSSGPAMVATEQYRSGWNRTFGNKPN